MPYFWEKTREEELSKFPRISLEQKNKLSQQSFALKRDMEVAKRKSADLRMLRGQDDENAAVT